MLTQVQPSDFKSYITMEWKVTQGRAVTTRPISKWVVFHNDEDEIIKCFKI